MPVEDRDFMKAMGYDLPDDAPGQVVSEGFEYYKHPAGLYLGFIGKLNPKYRDVNNKRCDPTTPGAVFDIFMLPLWITQYLGTASEPQQEQLITPKLELPDRPIAECYFNIMLDVDAKSQWRYKKMFEGWEIPGHSNLKILLNNPQKPTQMITNFRAFPAYYGLPVQFALTYKETSEKQSRYIDGSVLIRNYEQRIPVEKMAEFEKLVDAKVEQERQEREQQKQNPQTPPPADADFSSMGGNASLEDNSDSLDLDDLINS